MRDWLHVSSPNPSGEVGRILLGTPHEIGVTVAHEAIRYGQIIEEADFGRVLPMLKKAISQAVRDTVTAYSIA